jgi:hypothetical protein
MGIARHYAATGPLDAARRPAEAPCCTRSRSLR